MRCAKAGDDKKQMTEEAKKIVKFFIVDLSIPMRRSMFRMTGDLLLLPSKDGQTYVIFCWLREYFDWLFPCGLAIGRVVMTFP